MILLSLFIRFFAQTSLSLEEISLLFMEKGCRSALRSYLLHKLNALPYSKNAQRTLLCTWITEIFLDEICGMTVRLYSTIHSIDPFRER